MKNEQDKGEGGLFRRTFIGGAWLLLVVVFLGLSFFVGSFFWGIAKEARDIKLNHFSEISKPTLEQIRIVPAQAQPAQSKWQTQTSKPTPPVPVPVVVPACPPVQIFVQQQQQQQGGGSQSQQQGGGNQQNQKQEEGVVPDNSQPNKLAEYDASGKRSWRGPDYIYGGLERGRCSPDTRRYPGEYGRSSSRGNWSVDVGIYGGEIGGSVRWDNRNGGYGGGNNYYLPNSYFGRRQSSFLNRNWRMGSSSGQSPNYPDWYKENRSGQPPVYPDWHVP